MSTEKIANRQLFYILFMMRTTIVISLVPALTTADALQDAWAADMLSFFLAAILVLVIGGLGVLHPKQTIVEYSQQIVGVWLGKLVSLLTLSVFLYVAATDTRIYAEVLITGFLSETPLSFVVASMVFVSAIAAYNGIETIGRAADLFFPIFALMVITVLLMPIPQMVVLTRNLEPVLARGFGPILRGSLTSTAIILQFMVLTILIPSVNEPKKALRTALWSLAAASLALILAVAVTVVILGPDRGSRSVFPLFSMVRAVQVSEFLERIEVLPIFAWGFGMFIGVSVSLFSGARGMAQLLGLTTHRPLIGPMAVIWITLAVHGYADIFQLKSFFQPIIIGPFVLVAVLSTVGVLWVGYGIRQVLGGQLGEK